MLIFRNKRTKKIFRGSDFNYAPPKPLYADGIYGLPMFFAEESIERERKRRNLPEDKFEAVPVALVDLRTGATIKYQKEDTKT